MSASTMVIGGRTPPTSGVTFFFFAPLLIPVFILGVPLVDAVWAFIRRTASGQGFHTPDKDHIHHRLMRLGHGHRRTVIILWAWTALLCGFVLLPLFDTRANVFIPLGVAVLVIALFTWISPLRGGCVDCARATRVRGTGHPVTNPQGEGRIRLRIRRDQLEGPARASRPSPPWVRRSRGVSRSACCSGSTLTTSGTSRRGVF